jgi:hypothetical protein
MQIVTSRHRPVEFRRSDRALLAPVSDLHSRARSSGPVPHSVTPSHEQLANHSSESEDHMRCVTPLGFAVLVVVGACRDVRPTSPVASEHQMSANSIEALGDEVVRAIASALTQPELRLRVLQAFRSSPWVEHKLVLQEFVRTPLGRDLVRVGARATRSTEQELVETIFKLPELDFYVASRRDRLTWRGDNDFMVALIMSGDLKAVPAYTPHGALTYHPGKYLLESDPTLILLHPAEAKGRRIDPQSAKVGAVIQDDDDGDIAVQYIQHLAFGRSVVHDLRQDARGRWVTWPRDGRAGVDVINVMGAIECPPDYPDCTEGGPGGTTRPTRVTQILTRNVCDFDCSADNEFEFRATHQPTGRTGTARITGVSSGQYFQAGWFGNVSMISISPAAGGYVTVDVVETDPLSPDDNFDPNPFLNSSANGQEWELGDGRPTFCTGCKELNVKFAW